MFIEGAQAKNALKIFLVDDRFEIYRRFPGFRLDYPTSIGGGRRAHGMHDGIRGKAMDGAVVILILVSALDPTASAIGARAPLGDAHW